MNVTPWTKLPSGNYIRFVEFEGHLLADVYVRRSWDQTCWYWEIKRWWDSDEPEPEYIGGEAFERDDAKTAAEEAMKKLGYFDHE